MTISAPVAQLVSLAVEGVQVFAPWAVRNDRAGVALSQKQPKPIALVGALGGTQAARRQRFEQAAGDGRIAAVAGRYDERDGTATTIDNSMDFCRPPAARAADRLEIGPPFHPLLSLVVFPAFP